MYPFIKGGELMNELLERLKMYEPLFNRWKVDFIAMNYDDMAWVY